MSSNYSFQNITFQLSNYSSHYWNMEIIRHYYKACIAMDVLFAVAGTLLNVWFLAAFLLSPEIRARMRNKIICGMLVVNLTEALILSPLSIALFAGLLLDVYYSWDCYIISVYNNMYHIQDFVGNWYLLILLCFYTAQVKNFDPKFTPLWVKITNVVILISPWAVSLLFVPLTMKAYSGHYSEYSCLFATTQAIKVYKCLDTVVPQALATLLFAGTLVLKCRRYPQGRSSDTLRAQLIDDGPQIDPAYPFVAILVTAVLVDFGMMLYLMDRTISFGSSIEAWLYPIFAFGTVAYLRLILVPVMLLLFPDIRERVKTWRPWRRSALRTDFVVAYEKNAS